ncbi:MAG: phenylacetate--CoA ligase family protein, partial [Chloroflexota bacterium]|nr:phenylacetate--CoA ligase family protein [Chloroflexota bacterium]
MLPDPIEVASRDELEGHQLARLKSMLAEVLAGNAFYRVKYSGFQAEDLRSLAGLAQLPLTTKAEIAADQLEHPPFGTNLTYGPERYTRWFKTSGTTGKPINWLETNESIAWNARNWLTDLRAVGVTPADRLYFAFTFGPFLAFWGA